MAEFKYINISNRWTNSESVIKIAPLGNTPLIPKENYLVGTNLQTGVWYVLSGVIPSIMALTFIGNSRIDGYPIFHIDSITPRSSIATITNTGNPVGIYACRKVGNRYAILSNTPDEIIGGPVTIVSTIDDHIRRDLSEPKDFVTLKQIGGTYDTLEDCIESYNNTKAYTNIDSVMEIKMVRGRLISAVVIYDYNNEPEFERT